MIHLLRLQEDFPAASISKLINKSRGIREREDGLEEDQIPTKRDASTET